MHGAEAHPGRKDKKVELTGKKHVHSGRKDKHISEACSQATSKFLGKFQSTQKRG
jgi:hypothetical protein